MQRRALIRLLLCISTVYFCVSCGWAAAEETLKVGVSLHLSGEWAREGNAMLAGAQIAADEINAQGGSAGAKIHLIIEDNQSKAGPSAAAAKKLIELDHVAAALISSMTEVNFCGKEFQRARIPLVTLWDSSPDLEALGQGLFGLGPWTPDAGERLAKFAHGKLKASRAAVIHSNSRWSLSVAGFFTKEFERRGGKVIATVAADPAESDFRSLLLKVRQAKPDVLYAPMEYNIAAFIRQLAQSKWPTPVLMSDLLSADVLASVGAAAEGIYQTQLDELHAPLTAHLAELYKAKFQRAPELPYFSAWGYDGVRLVAEAYRRGGVSGIMRQLYATRGMPGASGVLTISPQGSSPTYESIFQVRGGKFVLVEQ